MGYGSDADVLFVHRAAAGRRRGHGRPRPPTRWPTRCAGCSASPRPTRPSRSTPTCGRRAGRARWCAACRPSASTTSAGCRSGRCRRCCGPCRSPGDEELGADFVALIDPIRYPADGLTGRAGRRDPADQGAGGAASGCRAAPTRPPTPSSAAAGWPTSSGPCSCCSSQHAARRPGAAGAPRRSTRWTALAAAGLLDAEQAEALRGGVGAGHPRPQRDLPGARPARATSCPGRASSWPASPGPAATARTSTPASSSTTTGGPPGTPARSSSRSSTGGRRRLTAAVEGCAVPKDPGRARIAVADGVAAGERRAAASRRSACRPRSPAPWSPSSSAPPCSCSSRVGHGGRRHRHHRAGRASRSPSAWCCWRWPTPSGRSRAATSTRPSPSACCSPRA